MNSVLTETPPALATCIDDALARIPPLWPLTHFVAVNPFVGLVDRPFGEACATLQRATGSAPVQTPADYLALHRAGEITHADLAAVADSGWTAQALVEALAQPDASRDLTPLATVADLIDAELPRAHWGVFIVDEISKWCGVAFDDNQTTWRSPWRTAGLYPGWREAAAHDRNPEAFGLTGFRAFVARLPAESEAAIAACVERLAPPPAELTDFLHRQLATIAGWAGHVQYRVREDALRGRSNVSLRDLLAIRLAYDVALLEAFGGRAPLRPHPLSRPASLPDERLLDALVRWQEAYEAGYRRRLALALAAQPRATATRRPDYQAIFCIDVRSEVFRHHLEAAAPGGRTLGFAGFFGFPVAHRSAGAGATGTRCPVLLVPAVESCERLAPAEETAARAWRSTAAAWKAFQNSAASCFSFVEAVGVSYAPALARRLRSRPAPACERAAPTFKTALSIDELTTLAEGALRNMGLIRDFARLVVVCGHGAQSVNNPHASGLECGACGGHAGDVNARLAVATFNDPRVRARLAGRGLALPADTWFVAALHNTTTDDVVLFGEGEAPASHHAELTDLRAALAAAGAAARAERAATLALAVVSPRRLAGALRARARDAAQVRPEWGLVNNAAFVAAPRSRTAALDLGGRVFLHDYAAEDDPDDRVLTLILSAPVVVASWINLQYYASRVDPARYGAGDKVLHNVAGGVGVLEGNGGDLKVGLPLQSLHDGRRFVHEPRRLTVFIEAEPARISAVLSSRPAVRQLFDHGWISLVALTGRQAWRYAEQTWHPLAEPAGS